MGVFGMGHVAITLAISINLLSMVKRRTIALGIISASVLAAGIFSTLMKSFPKKVVDSQSSKVVVRGGQASHSATHYEDDRVMVGETQFVFAGKVIGIIGNQTVNRFNAATQYDI